MYDVPSILSTLHQNIYQLCGGSTEGRRDEDAQELWQRELGTFLERLGLLVKQQGVSDIVKILLLDNEEGNEGQVYALMKDAYNAKFLQGHGSLTNNELFDLTKSLSKSQETD